MAEEYEKENASEIRAYEIAIDVRYACVSEMQEFSSRETLYVRYYRNEKRIARAYLCYARKMPSATRINRQQRLSSSTITERGTGTNCRVARRRNIARRHPFCFTSFCVCKNCSQVASTFFVAVHFVCAECESI